MATLALKGVRKEYGKSVVALKGLDLDIGDGEFFVLLGPSGAGKTTTLKCVAGLEQPTLGHVEIGGLDVSNIEPNARKVAMAFENYALYPQETVYDNIAFPLRSRRYYREPGEAQSIIERVTTTLGINHLLQRLPRELSGGQKQRVALARVLVRPADVLLLDEPLSHLDAKLRAAMRAELKSLGELQSTTSLYVTHDYLEALALGDRIAVLNEGELVQVGTREEIWHRPVNTFVAKAFGQPQINLVEGEVIPGHDGPRFHGANGAVDLPMHGFDVTPGRKVITGMRPRDLVMDAKPGMAHIKGSVWVTEPLGRQQEVTLEAGGQHIAVITPLSSLAIGDTVTISVPVSRILLFDAESGQRIPAKDDAAGAARPIAEMEVSRG
jgi:ABC-type sugar transport system ATPase subunit